MDPVFRFPASPGTPLFPLSPERVNRQHLPQSPSLPSNLSEPFLNGHTKAPSDVQGKVAQFNNLSKEAAQRRRDNEAAIQRAMLGREEAESETRRMKEEHKILRKEIEDGRGRERRVGERLEALMVSLPNFERGSEYLNLEIQEELQRTKETHVHSQTLYEKEVRRARKEAFKASSASVKLQEELKTARNRFTLMREEAETQRRKADGRDQDVFAAKYQNVGLQEEIEKIRQQLKTIEEERDTLKTTLKEEEVARIAAEGKIPLPVSHEQDEFSSPKKPRRRSHRDSFKENQDPVDLMETEEEDCIQATLAIERKLRQRAEEQIDFMKMECQFRCCSCRIAESQGKTYIHDSSFAQHISAYVNAVEGGRSGTPEEMLLGPTPEKTNARPSQSYEPLTPEPASRLATPPKSPTTASNPRFQTDQPASTPPSAATRSHPDLDALVRFSPTSGTFYTTPAAVETSSPGQSLFSRDALQTPTALLRFSPQFSLSTSGPPAQVSSPPSSPPHLRYPTTPRPLPVPPYGPNHITQTVTTTIPLAVPPSPFTANPTMTREEALEQIRQRRGRARSIAAGHSTPRKQMIDLSGLRRDISAPAGRGV